MKKRDLKAMKSIHACFVRHPGVKRNESRDASGSGKGSTGVGGPMQLGDRMAAGTLQRRPKLRPRPQSLKAYDYRSTFHSAADSGTGMMPMAAF